MPVYGVHLRGIIQAYRGAAGYVPSVMPNWKTP